MTDDRDRKLCPATPEEIDRLVRTYGLTGGEAKLAAALAAGTSLADYADAVSINVGTARWYLKQALQKTGTHRQSELIRRISGDDTQLG